jgi:hypothetical protein
MSMPIMSRGRRHGVSTGALLPSLVGESQIARHGFGKSGHPRVRLPVRTFDRPTGTGYDATPIVGGSIVIAACARIAN